MDYAAAAKQKMSEAQVYATGGEIAKATELTNEAMRIDYLHHISTDLANLTSEEWETMRDAENKRRAAE